MKTIFIILQILLPIGSVIVLFVQDKRLRKYKKLYEDALYKLNEPNKKQTDKIPPWTKGLFSEFLGRRGEPLKEDDNEGEYSSEIYGIPMITEDDMQKLMDRLDNSIIGSYSKINVGYVDNEPAVNAAILQIQYKEAIDSQNYERADEILKEAKRNNIKLD